MQKPGNWRLGPCLFDACLGRPDTAVAVVGVVVGVAMVPMPPFRTAPPRRGQLTSN